MRLVISLTYSASVNSSTAARHLNLITGYSSTAASIAELQQHIGNRIHSKIKTERECRTAGITTR